MNSVMSKLKPYLKRPKTWGVVLGVLTAGWLGAWSYQTVRFYTGLEAAAHQAFGEGVSFSYGKTHMGFSPVAAVFRLENVSVGLGDDKSASAALLTLGEVTVKRALLGQTVRVVLPENGQLLVRTKHASSTVALQAKDAELTYDGVSGGWNTSAASFSAVPVTGEHVKPIFSVAEAHYSFVPDGKNTERSVEFKNLTFGEDGAQRLGAPSFPFLSATWYIEGLPALNAVDFTSSVLSLDGAGLRDMLVPYMKEWNNHGGHFVIKNVRVQTNGGFSLTGEGVFYPYDFTHMAGSGRLSVNRGSSFEAWLRARGYAPSLALAEGHLESDFQLVRKRLEWSHADVGGMPSLFSLLSSAGEVVAEGSDVAEAAADVKLAARLESVAAKPVVKKESASASAKASAEEAESEESSADQSEEDE